MKEFYGERIELSVLIASDAFATFRSGGDSRLVVTWTTSPSREAQRGKTGSFTQIDTEAVSDAKVRADAASFVLDHEQVQFRGLQIAEVLGASLSSSPARVPHLRCLPDRCQGGDVALREATNEPCNTVTSRR